jgi:fluoroacetyl-CoA thioesterase
MKPTLKAGLRHSFSYKVPENKTVPYTYPESPIIAQMPEVFATGFMIVLMEWTCTQLMEPHLDVGEGSLGTHVDVSHLAATPPGMTVKVDVEVAEVQGVPIGTVMSRLARARVQIKTYLDGGRPALRRVK